MLSALSTKDIFLTAGAAVALALLLRVFVIGVFAIPSHSMENTLAVGDHILVSKLATTLGSIERGDIVVFEIPDSLRGTSADQPYIKRVIGIGGDTVFLTRLGITVNGRLLPDPQSCASQSPVKSGHRTMIVPPHHYLVIGDNRANSWDSRFWGFLPEDNIIGTPLFIYWSPDWDRVFTRVQ